MDDQPHKVCVIYRDGLFAVECDPPCPAYDVQSFAVWRAAMRYASEIRQATGWPVFDHTVDINMPPPRAA